MSVTARRSLKASSMAAPMITCACSHWRLTCSITRLTSAMVRSGPPIRLTSTASDSPSIWPPSSIGCASSLSITSRERVGPMASATAKQLSRVAVAQERGQVGEMNFDQPLVHQQPPDAAHAGGEEVVRDLEGLQHAGVLVNHLEHLLVGQTDDAIGRGLELRQPMLRQALPAAAFALEGQSSQTPAPARPPPSPRAPAPG